jgi:hypothetical protein
MCKPGPVVRGLFDRFDQWATPLLTNCILNAYDWLIGKK